ncbi:hypothetical protein IFM89_024098 [Coptis chinensis]|uniref:Uncharacterized protein n=1 Tax=Coptis chinensis TaxID=261450 RepID=A0A835IAW0_9MAGN|nr:hypothetical protein IFM89_024098 [Coptis chinensis]
MKANYENLKKRDTKVINLEYLGELPEYEERGNRDYEPAIPNEAIGNANDATTSLQDIRVFVLYLASLSAYSAHLKRSGKMELPHWTNIVKTATFKELASYGPDWYYVRVASMARKIYLRQGIGVGGFRKIYGGRKRNGSRPPD